MEAEVNKKGICRQEGPSVALHVMQGRAYHVQGLGEGSRMLRGSEKTSSSRHV